MAMGCSSAVSSLSSSSSAALSFSAARSPCSSSAKVSLPPLEVLRSNGSLPRALSLPRTPRRRASFSCSSSSARHLIFTADGARKALEQAFQGKNSLAKKWEEEIRKRELSGGDGGSGGGGGGGSWGGGGGGDDEEMGEGFGQDEPWDWEEVGQTFMATFALMILYISITHGPKQVLKKFKLLFRYIRQGFRLRKIPDEYLTAEGSGIESDEDEEEYDSDDDEDDDATVDSDFVINRRAKVSNNAQEVKAQNNEAVDYESEEDEDDDLPMPPKPQSKRDDLLSKRQAEQKERLLQLLTPKDLRQQEENK